MSRQREPDFYLDVLSEFSHPEWLTTSCLLGRTPFLTLWPLILLNTTNMVQWLLERENSRAILYWRWNNSSAWKARAAVAASTSTSNATCSLPVFLNPLWTPDFTCRMVAPCSKICVLLPIHFISVLQGDTKLGNVLSGGIGTKVIECKSYVRWHQCLTCL